MREEWGRLVALLLAQFRRLDLVEDALGDAVEAASRTWPADGVPANPAGWLMTAARRRLLDRLRTEEVARRKQPLLADRGRAQRQQASPHDGRRRRAGRGRRAAAGADVRPPGARPRVRQRAEPAARARRADCRHRPALPRPRADHGRPDHPGQEAHRRRRHPLRRAGRLGAARPTRHGRADRLPRLHRRLRPRHRARPAARRRPPPRRSGWCASCWACAPTSRRWWRCSP